MRARFNQLPKFKCTGGHIKEVRRLFVSLQARSDSSLVEPAIRILGTERLAIERDTSGSDYVFLDEEVKSASPPDEKKPRYHPKLIDGVAQQAIINNQQENKTCAITIFANQTVVGGIPWPSNHRAQEENILLHSTAPLRLPASYFIDRADEEATPRREGFSHFGGGFATKNNLLLGNGRNLLVLKNKEEENASIEHRFSAIFVAAPNLGNGEIYNYYSQDNLYLIEMAKIIRAQYRLALKTGADKLIAGAIGCGVFGNNPYLVAYLHLLVLEEPEFHSLAVDFYVPGKGSENYLAFEFMLENFPVFLQFETTKTIQLMIAETDPATRQEKRFPIIPQLSYNHLNVNFQKATLESIVREAKTDTQEVMKQGTQGSVSSSSSALACLPAVDGLDRPNSAAPDNAAPANGSTTVPPSLSARQAPPSSAGSSSSLTNSNPLIDYWSEVLKNNINNEVNIDFRNNGKYPVKFTARFTKEPSIPPILRGVLCPIEIISKAGQKQRVINLWLTPECCKNNTLETLFNTVECKNEAAAKILKYIIHRAKDPNEYHHWYSFSCFGAVSRNERLTAAFNMFKAVNTVSDEANTEAKTFKVSEVKEPCAHWNDVKPAEKPAIKNRRG